MIRIRIIVVLALAVLAAAVAAGCGGSASDSKTDAVVPTNTTTTETTTSTGTTTTKIDPNAKPDTGGNLSDAPLSKDAVILSGKKVKLPTASGGSLEVEFKAFIDPVLSVSKFDEAPDGQRYLGVAIEAKLSGKPDEVKTAINIVDDSGSPLPLSLLADPNCGRNLVNIPGIGTKGATKGCIVTLAPKGVKAKELVVTVRSGKDSDTVKVGRIPL